MHLSLSVGQKMELMGAIKHLTEGYSMAAAIVYDLNKEKDKMLTFYSDSGDKNY